MSHLHLVDKNIVNLTTSSIEWFDIWHVLAQVVLSGDASPIYKRAHQGLGEAVLIHKDISVRNVSKAPLTLSLPAPLVRDIFESILNLSNAVSDAAEKNNDLSMWRDAGDIGKMIRPLMDQAEEQGWTPTNLEELKDA